MSTLWVIIRSNAYVESSDDTVPPPTICGAYSTRSEAVEEILKLYIEDDIDLVGKTEDGESFDHRPTKTIVRQQREALMNEGYHTYSIRGNLYTLVECVLGAKHDFENDVLKLYKSCK